MGTFSSFRTLNQTPWNPGSAPWIRVTRDWDEEPRGELWMSGVVLPSCSPFDHASNRIRHGRLHMAPWKRYIFNILEQNKLLFPPLSSGRVGGGGGFIKIKSEGPDALLFFLKLWVLVAMTTSSTPGCHGHVGGFHGHIIRSSLPWTHHPVLIAMDASVFSTDTSSTPRYLGHIIRSWLPWIHPPGLVAIDI